VFERFYRSPDAARDGTGIGLALAQALVSLHRGTIRVDSPDDTGSTFIVEWPAQPADAPPLERGSLAPSAPAASPPPAPSFLHDSPSDEQAGEDRADDQTTVLVVNDDPDMRAFVRSILAADYRVETAPDGAAALDAARNRPPDCIVADVMMPRLNGMALVDTLRDDPETDCIPVILLTARADTEDRISGLDTGADAYVTKPFVPDVLRAHVRRHIATRHRLRERLAAETEAKTEAAPSPVQSALEAVAPSDDAVVVDLRAYLHTHLTDPDLEVTDMAAALSMSPRTFRRHLKDATGQTPSQFLRTVRIETATHLLKQGEGSISEIAYAVGFNSHSYFSRTFKDEVGCSPSAFLQRAA